MLKRAYSLLEIKSIDEEQRIIEGIATTPSTDRVGDVVEPKGAQFSLPIPFLYQHDSEQPLGHVIDAKVAKDGITVRVQIAKGVTTRIEEAWSLIRAGLVRGLSIGFRAIDTEQIPNSWGYIYKSWEWLELSAVTIPANAEASISQIKSIDRASLAATGKGAAPVVRLDPPPGDSGKSTQFKQRPKEGTTMKTIAEQIAALEAKRAAHESRLEDIQTKAVEAGRTKEADEREEFDGLRDEITAIDAELKDLRDLEAVKARGAKSVNTRIETEQAGSTARAVATPGLVVKTPPKLEPGIRFARLAKVKAIARLDGADPLRTAERIYGADSEPYAIIKTGEVAPGTTLSGNWAADLVGAETSAFADFANYLRPATILGKFGVNGVPGLRHVPFREPLVSQTGAGGAWWVGEGKPKPVTAFEFDRTTLTPLKVANICILTEENIRSSAPSSEMIIRDSLRDALAATLDKDFIDPSNGGSSNVKPASITNGADTVGSTGPDADDIRLDIRALFQKFIDADNPPENGVWIMSTANALALSLSINALGQREFPGVNMKGGTFEGLPVVASRYASTIVALVNASDIYEADDGETNVDMSREASIEMKDAPSLTSDSTSSTGASLVSLWQSNLVGLRAERTINWKRRRESAVAYLTSVTWGGSVPAS